MSYYEHSEFEALARLFIRHARFEVLARLASALPADATIDPKFRWGLNRRVWFRAEVRPVSTWVAEARADWEFAHACLARPHSTKNQREGWMAQQEQARQRLAKVVETFVFPPYAELFSVAIDSPHQWAPLAQEMKQAEAA